MTKYKNFNIELFYIIQINYNNIKLLRYVYIVIIIV